MAEKKSIFKLFANTETSTRSKVIWTIVVIVLFVVILLGLIGYLIYRLMKWQGKAVDKLMYNVTVTRVIQNKKHFKKVADIKSSRYFFKQAWIPFVLMLIAALFLIIFYSVSGLWSFNIFSNGVADADGVIRSGGTGISTIFYSWDFTKILQNTDDGLLLNWPQTIAVPHFSAEAWPSYVFFVLATPGVIWFLVTVQCYLARFLRIRKLASIIYDKNLSNFRYDPNNPNANKPDLENYQQN